MPNATELPKQPPRPNRALSSVLNFKIFLLKKNPIKKIIIPEPKKINNNLNKIISGNSILQKLLIRAIGKTSEKLGLTAEGYRILSNAGTNANQEVPHLHFHIFGGRNLGRML